MQIDILNKNENKLLNRTEAEFSIKECKITPSRKEIRAKIAALLNSKEQLVVVDRVKHKFGSTEVKGSARAYKEEAALKKLEPEFIIARNEGKKKKKEEAPKPAKPEEGKEGAGEKKPEEKPGEKPEGKGERPGGKEEEKKGGGKDEAKEGKEEDKSGKPGEGKKGE